jgi:hypothetical protein
MGMKAIEDVMAQATLGCVQLLHKRLRANVFTTEDSVRYTFFAALLRCGVEQEQVVLEARHPSIPGALLDVLIYNASQDPIAEAAMEFKYDRAIPGGGTLPRTQKSGKAFAELARLLRWPNPIARFFIYVTGRELYGHLTSSRSPLTQIFTASCGQTYDLDATFFTTLPNTFRDATGDWPGPATIQVMTTEKLPLDHYLWVFSIESKGRDQE